MNGNQSYDILRKVLPSIDPAALTYEEWLQIGMALKADGFACSDWDEWSRRDSTRYHKNECERKWNGFTGSGITCGTVVQIAKEHGWIPDNDFSLNWDSVIVDFDNKMTIIDPNWIEGQEIAPPTDNDWHPAQQLIRYLEILFEAGENVGYVTESWKGDKGRYLPTKGACDRTAGELIEALHKCGDDIGAALGDYKPEAGAWIRFNPLDGKGVKNENVTDYRYALVESDCMPIEHQSTIIHELELPVAVLVHSGGKSLHAIVRIDAASYTEYRQRVDFLYDVCKHNGLKIDQQNRNPSRLSRMPGVIRNGQKQYIVAENIGKPSFQEWKEWIDSANDNLPDVEQLADVWNNLPPLAPILIDNVLRKGHKMLIAGPSKAGKSYILIELCIAIAEGQKWLCWKCAQGKVLYVNLELDSASCKHRFRDVYQSLGIPPANLQNIDIWNLRGKAVPMNELAPKLIRRCQKKNYTAVIIDPIYKVITGDENAADQMSKFCNQFDKICTELGCSTIYCHHHSKGAQGSKNSMDRASGSGVFARDPDALLDMIELEIPPALYDQQENKAGIAVCMDWLNKLNYNWEDDLSPDDRCSLPRMRAYCEKRFSAPMFAAMMDGIRYAQQQVHSKTAWRIEGTLREFGKFPPVNVWFDYPVHHLDDSECLQDIDPSRTQGNTWKQNFKTSGKVNKTDAERKTDRVDSINIAYEACAIGGKVTVEALANYMGISIKTVKRHLKEAGNYLINHDGEVGKTG